MNRRRIFWLWLSLAVNFTLTILLHGPKGTAAHRTGSGYGIAPPCITRTRNRQSRSQNRTRYLCTSVESIKLCTIPGSRPQLTGLARPAIKLLLAYGSVVHYYFLVVSFAPAGAKTHKHLKESTPLPQAPLSTGSLPRNSCQLRLRK